MITNEQWKPVAGFTRYEVSNKGNVRNIHTKVLKAIRRTKTGYCITDLKENGIQKTSYIHRLVAEAFIENHDGLPVVNHKDENKSNNSVENLEWCTATYNNHYGSHIERIKATQTERCGKTVMKIDSITGEVLEVFPSLSEAAKSIGVKKQAIDWALADNNHTSGGFRWVVV